MIHLLAEYCRKQGLVSEGGFRPRRVRWAICCDYSGRYTGLVPLGDVTAKKNPGQEFPCCPYLGQPELVAGGVSRSHFLVDTAEVVLLLSKVPDEPKLVAKHEFFRELLRQAALNLPELAPVVNLLGAPGNMETIRAACKREKVKPGDKMTFSVESSVLVEQEFWHDWWRGFRQTISTRKGIAGLRRCFVAGDLAEPVRLHDTISGLKSAGGLRPPPVLVGFDKDAFESFGFTRGENAAVSEAAMSAYRAGLNELLTRSSVQVGNATVAFWFKDRVEDAENPLWALLGEPGKTEDLAARQRAIEFLRSVHTGQARSMEGNRYYALTLSDAGGRVMVRGWMEGSFESLASALTKWFADLRIVSSNGDSLSPPQSLFRLSYSCLSLRSQRAAEPKQREQRDDDQRRFSDPLFRAAMTGTAFSDLLPFRILACLRPELSSAEEKKEDAPLQPNRFAVLRAYLVRYFRNKGDRSMSDAITPALSPDLPSAAYQCGRVLAILAALQKRALGSVGAGVIQRYYASASTNPGLVFGRLIKNAQYHIEKLGPDKSRYLESLLAETMACVSNGFPQVLSLQEQGLFGLGYYHQIADLRKKRVVNDDSVTPESDMPQEGAESDVATD